MSKTFRLTVLRHSSSTKPADKTYAADQARVLTDDGFDLARARRIDLGNRDYQLIVASPAKRAMDTAAIVAGPNGAVDVIDVPEFGIDDPAKSEEGLVIDELFQKLGYKSLKAYREAEGGHHVMAHGIRAAKALLSHLELIDREEDPSALVVGHAVTTQAMVYALAHGKPAVQKKVLNAVLGECEGFTFTLEDDFVCDFQILGPTMVPAE